jgi:hypothetical protein
LGHACNNERIKEDTLDKWLDKVKIIDEKKHRKHQQQHTDMEEAACSHLKRNTMSAGLTKPPHCYNTFHGGPTDKPLDSVKGKPFDPTKSLLKLTDAEHTLLFDNKGCLKCHQFFINHCLANCPNEFPSGMGYKALTPDNVKSAHCKMNNLVTSVTESSHRSGILLITAIMPPMNDSEY